MTSYWQEKTDNSEKKPKVLALLNNIHTSLTGLVGASQGIHQTIVEKSSELHTIITNDISHIEKGTIPESTYGRFLIELTKKLETYSDQVNTVMNAENTSKIFSNYAQAAQQLRNQFAGIDKDYISI